MTHQLIIPTIGTRIRLTQPWTFTLHDEYRNHKTHQKLGLLEEYMNRYGEKCYRYVRSSVTIPEDTTLSVGRIYIKKGASNFDSMTFSVVSCPKDVRWRKTRFWAKLYEVNSIVCEFDPDTLPKGG